MSKRYIPVLFAFTLHRAHVLLLKFQVANILLISNKISINKNKQIYFFYFFSIFLYWYFTLPHGSGDWGASFTYEGLVTKTNSHGWNFMKFHPNSTTNSTLFNVLILKVITFRRWKSGITFRKFIFQRIMTEKSWIYVNFRLRCGSPWIAHQVC